MLIFVWNLMIVVKWDVCYCEFMNWGVVNDGRCIVEILFWEC